uniref:Uncharacterized protein n=1 Tax=Anguilla anguilla TaxID=7936 RepID=A0A0E9RKK9_ANGAN
MFLHFKELTSKPLFYLTQINHHLFKNYIVFKIPFLFK